MTASKFTELLDTTTYSIHNVSLEDILAETERRRRSSSSVSTGSLPTPIHLSPTSETSSASKESSLTRSITTWKKPRNAKKWEWLGGKSR